MSPHLRPAFVHRLQPERLRSIEPLWRAIGDRHRRRTVDLRQQPGEEPDHPGPCHQHLAAAQALPGRRDVVTGELDGRVQRCVGAGRAHLGEVDPQDGINAAWDRHDDLRAGAGGVARHVAVRHPHQRSPRQRR
jgi:hypothetical protein